MASTVSINQSLPRLNYNAEAGNSQKITDYAQGVIGFVLGLGIHRIYGPFTERIIKALSIPYFDPFMGLPFVVKIAITPFVCILGPIMEEHMFRGDLQGLFKEQFSTFYLNLGLPAADLNARISAIFFSSVIFGVIHFSNAAIFWCNPILFLPQVVAATFMGFLFGIAKEITGGLTLPAGMHIGNNTLAMANYLYHSIK